MLALKVVQAYQFSTAWIGAVLAFLTLAVTGLTSQEEGLVQAVYLVMDLITWWVIVPLALGGFLSGIVYSIGTRWGRFQYYWVVIKFVLTLLSTIVLIIHTQPIGQLAAVADKSASFGATLQKTQLQMVISSGAALLVLIVLTLLSVYKPRGLTRYGQRKQRKDIETLTIIAGRFKMESSF